MKNWLIFIGVVIIVAFLETYQIFQHIEGRQTNENNIAIKEAKSAVSISHIEGVTSFDGQVAYHVVSAMDHSGHHVYVWVPDQKGHGKIFKKRASSGISKKTILQKMKNQFPYNKIFTVQLGMKDNQPVWAVTYLDKNDHYSVSYFDYFSGQDMTIIIT